MEPYDAPPARRSPEPRALRAEAALDAPRWPAAQVREAAARRTSPPAAPGLPEVPARLLATRQVVPVGPVPPTEPIDLRALRGGGQTLIAADVDEIAVPPAAEALLEPWFDDDTFDGDTAEAAPVRAYPPTLPPWWALAIPLAGAVMGSTLAVGTLALVLLT